tara:strand:- start:5 stop:376 length:372 start_codon:yes stop_codon:yes gene_type:complete
MKLTETKLKQMILDEMKSNLPPADQAQLQADIERAEELSVEIDQLTNHLSDAYDRAYDGIDDPHMDPEVNEIRKTIQPLSREIEKIFQKYNISLYTKKNGFTADVPHRNLVRMLKKKFRRKSL